MLGGVSSFNLTDASKLAEAISKAPGAKNFPVNAILVQCKHTNSETPECDLMAELAKMGFVHENGRSTSPCDYKFTNDQNKKRYKAGCWLTEEFVRKGSTQNAETAYSQDTSDGGGNDIDQERQAWVIFATYKRFKDKGMELDRLSYSESTRDADFAVSIPHRSAFAKSCACVYETSKRTITKSCKWCRLDMTYETYEWLAVVRRKPRRLSALWQVCEGTTGCCGNCYHFLLLTVQLQ